ncbi:MAG: mechanosensitive ion channel family protein [Lentisphaerales bacterium]|nr:mechanosensitive ion channel family protein [Lentisphaerales bacterium]
MYKFLFSFILFFSLFCHAQDEEKIKTTPEIVNLTLNGFLEEAQDEDWDDAKGYFLSKNISETQLKDFADVVVKVQSYLKRHAITPVSEGEKLISIPLRQSVIYLHKIEEKWHFTNGTLANISRLHGMADLLNSPEKTLDYFRLQVKAGDYDEAMGCFVPDTGYKYDEKKLSLLGEVVDHLRKSNVVGQFQGKGENVTLITYPIGDRSIALVRQSGDWLITINTRNKINVIYQDYKTTHVRSIFPEELNDTYLIMKNWQWIGVLAIIIIGIIAQWILQFLFKKTVIKRFVHGNNIEVRKPRFASVSIFCISISWYFLTPVLSLDVEGVKTFMNAAILTMIVSAMFILVRGTDIVKNVLLAKAKETDNKVDDVLIPMFHKIIRLAIFIIGLILIASNIGVNVAGLVAGLGIAGMAFALAAKDTVENIFGSVTVLTDKPFEVGDWVVINGVEGTVEQIGLRSTRIRTFYCSQVNVPNSTLIKATVDNYGRRTYRRIKTYLSLTYDTPPEKIEAFCEGVREIIRNHPTTRKDYYHVYLNQFNAASLDVLLYCFIDCDDWAIELRERQRLFMDIMRLATRLEVEFAFPTQTIHMANSEDLHAPVKETSLDNIAVAYESGKKEGMDIISETKNIKGTAFPNSIDYHKGNPYIEPKK